MRIQVVILILFICGSVFSFPPDRRRKTGLLDVLRSSDVVKQNRSPRAVKRDQIKCPPKRVYNPFTNQCERDRSRIIAHVCCLGGLGK